MYTTTRRSSLNKNLILTNADVYRGLRVYQKKGPLIVNYLDRTYETIQRSLEQYPRTLALRVDLRFPRQPHAWWHGQESGVLQDFFDSFKSKIEHDRRRAKAYNRYAHDSIVRYIWAMEQVTGDSPHFHCLLLLNRDAYYVLGDIRSMQENLANRIGAALGRALGLPWAESHPLVHFPKRGVYRLDRGDQAGFAKLFYRASYMTKEATKSYGDWVHAFGNSRQ